MSGSATVAAGGGGGDDGFGSEQDDAPLGPTLGPILQLFGITGEPLDVPAQWIGDV